jgi:hypothetical protein
VEFPLDFLGEEAAIVFDWDPRASAFRASVRIGRARAERPLTRLERRRLALSVIRASDVEEWLAGATPADAARVAEAAARRAAELGA